MMKRLFSFLILAVVCSAAAFAQTSLVATLTHGGNITTFYGASGLVEAYAAAAEGDVITLSAGEFSAVDLEKAITIRGAGMQLTREKPTVLAGNFTMNLPTGTLRTLTLEGVECTGTVNIYGTYYMEAATILKCYFQQDVTCVNSNPTFINCVFQSRLTSTYNKGDTDYFNTNVCCYGCVIYAAYSGARCTYNGNTYTAKFDMENCFAGLPIYATWDYSFLKNCIVLVERYVPSSNCYITNSLCFFGNNGTLDVTNMFFTGEWSEIFKSFTGGNFGMETYELTDEAKAKYKGADGTQVGIYGGKYPFNPIPSTAQVKKFGSVDNSGA